MCRQPVRPVGRLEVPRSYSHAHVKSASRSRASISSPGSGLWLKAAAGLRNSPAGQVTGLTLWRHPFAPCGGEYANGVANEFASVGGGLFLSCSGRAGLPPNFKQVIAGGSMVPARSGWLIRPSPQPATPVIAPPSFLTGNPRPDESIETHARPGHHAGREYAQTAAARFSALAQASFRNYL